MELFLKLVSFSILFNWAVALQMLNQFSSDKRTKLISVTLSMFLAGAAGLALLI